MRVKVRLWARVLADCVLKRDGNSSFHRFCAVFMVSIAFGLRLIAFWLGRRGRIPTRGVCGALVHDLAIPFQLPNEGLDLMATQRGILLVMSGHREQVMGSSQAQS